MSAEMTAEDFDNIASRLSSRIDPSSIEMARMVLVQGHRQTDVAAMHGVTKALVNRNVRRVRQEALEVPSNWTTVEGYFPPEIAQALSKYAADLKAKVAEGGSFWSVPVPVVKLIRATTQKLDAE